MAFRLGGAALLPILLALSCGGPQPMLPPPQPRVEQTTEVHQCKVQKDVARPMLVEWPAVEKAGLQSSATRGVVVVRYDGCRLRRLETCTLEGTYEFIETSRAKDGFVVRDKNELFAKLPLGAVSLEGELRQGNALDLSYVAVGTRTTPVVAVSRDMLTGNCQGATHFVRSMVVGAYELASEWSAGGGAGVTVGGAGAGGSTESERAVIRSDGDLAACAETTTPADSQQCQAIVQLVLEPISETPVAAAPAAAAPAGPAAPATALPPPGATSFLVVRLEEPADGAEVYVDDKLVGEAPWNGQVTPGEHIVRVEAPGKRPAEEEIDVEPDMTENLEFKLRPADKLETGIFYFGLVYDFGAGGAFPENGANGGAAYTSLTKLNIGFHITEKPVWWELGIVGFVPPERWVNKADYGSDNDYSWSDESATEEIVYYKPAYLHKYRYSAALLNRLLRPYAPPRFYLAWEIEIGFALWEKGAYGATRLGFTWFLNDWVEVRVNPIGLRLDYYLLELVVCENRSDHPMECDSKGDGFAPIWDSEDWSAYLTVTSSIGFLLRI